MYCTYVHVPYIYAYAYAYMYILCTMYNYIYTLHDGYIKSNAMIRGRKLRIENCGVKVKFHWKNWDLDSQKRLFIILFRISFVWSLVVSFWIDWNWSHSLPGRYVRWWYSFSWHILLLMLIWIYRIKYPTSCRFPLQPLLLPNAQQVVSCIVCYYTLLLCCYSSF
jgi:hypothetical protein